MRIPSSLVACRFSSSSTPLAPRSSLLELLSGHGREAALSLAMLPVQTSARRYSNGPSNCAPFASATSSAINEHVDDSYGSGLCIAVPLPLSIPDRFAFAPRVLIRLSPAVRALPLTPFALVCDASVSQRIGSAGCCKRKRAKRVKLSDWYRC